MLDSLSYSGHALKSSAKSRLQVLILEPDLAVLDYLRMALGGRYSLSLFSDEQTLLDRLEQRESPDLLLLALHSNRDPLPLLTNIRCSKPNLPVIVLSCSSELRDLEMVIRLGVRGIVMKPFVGSDIEQAIEEHLAAVEKKVPAADALKEIPLNESHSFVRSSKRMRDLESQAALVARADIPLLILGESGTGKEIVARTIHYNGPNATHPFIPVDCGSLVPTLIESELFGYVKGAFTGANRSKEGLLATAEGGTVFLDEIGELPLDLQAKLLRALQEKEIRPIGSNQRIPIHVRILAATNRDLSAMVEQGKFRKDLYFRLNVVNVKVPSLRERRSDVSLLAAHFLERRRRETGVLYTLSDDVLRVLSSYDWPGNVRELENTIERACALSSGPVLHLGDMPTQLQEHRMHWQTAAEAPREEAVSMDSSILTIAEMEKQAILNTLRQLNGDKLTAARLLGIGKTTLYRKLKEYGIDEAPEF